MNLPQFNPLQASVVTKIASLLLKVFDDLFGMVDGVLLDFNLRDYLFLHFKRWQRDFDFSSITQRYKVKRCFSA